MRAKHIHPGSKWIDTLSVLLPTAEQSLLLRACLHSGTDGHRDLEEWLHCTQDVRCALGGALKWLLPSLHYAFQHSGLAAPDALATILRTAWFYEELRGQVFRRMCREVLSTLAENGIQYAALKGIALADGAYPDWRLRHCHEADILCANENLLRAVEILADCGFKPTQRIEEGRGPTTLHHGSGFSLNLHRELFPIPYYRIPFDGFWGRTRLQEIAGIPCRTPGWSDMLLHVCGSAACSKNRGSLRWACDAWHLAGEGTAAGWEAFAEGALTGRLALPLAIMLRYVKDALGARIPLPILRRLEEETTRSPRIAVEAALFGARGSHRNLLRAARGWRIRIEIATWLLFPSPTYLRWLAPASSPWALARRYLGLWGRYAARLSLARQRKTRNLRRRGTVWPVGDILENPSWRKTTSSDGGGSPQLTQRQKLLLRAAFADGSEALSAWEAWKQLGGPETTDPTSQRIMVLAYRNLQSSWPEEVLAERLRSQYKLTWYRNQRLLNRMAPVLAALEKAGIPTLLLKGAALTLLHYRDYGLRPMADVDVLVPRNRAPAAITVLQELGFTPLGRSTEQLTTAYIDSRHSHGFEDAARLQLDLHWHALNDARYAAVEKAFWSGSVSTSIAGVPTRALNATDQLFHVLVHGTRRSQTPVLHYIADAMTILSTSIDWDRLLVQSSEWGLVLRVREALRLLAQESEAPILSSALETMESLPVAPYEHREREAMLFPIGADSRLLLLYLQHRRGEEHAKGRLRRLITFPRFLQAIWGLHFVWQVPFALVWKAAKHLVQQASRLFTQVG